MNVDKKVINSLPNDENPCNKINYATCVINRIVMIAKESYNCTLVFVGKDDRLKVCPNSVALKLVREMKEALKQNQYEDCFDIKACKDVQFTTSLHYSQSIYNPYTTFLLNYKGYIVEHLEDSYVYSFVTIFSEIGGSLGVLIGLSCMTIVDFFIRLYKIFCKI